MNEGAVASSTPPSGQPTKSFWGHPFGLWMLLWTTVGINFGFYGFRAYLAPYFEHFFINLGPAAAQRQSDLVSSGFFALMYAVPIIGGYVADKVLGETRAVAMSLWLSVIALLVMALPTLFGFEIGLALFALATGLGIPMTVLIGRNYMAQDPRRESGYMLYYMAINLGAFIAPPICAGLVGSHFGYQWGFVAAAVGMAFSAALFQLRKHRLSAVVPGGGYLHGRMAGVWVLVAIAVLLYPTALLLTVPIKLRWAMYILMGLLVLYFAVQCVRRGDRVQTQRYLALLLLFVAMVVFWALSLQGVTSLNFFARDHVNAPFHYTLFQSFNSWYILLLAVPFALLWPWLDRHHADPSTPRKFGIGILLVALGYGVLTLAIVHLAHDGHVAWEWLALCYLLSTLGELALSPIGYALVGQLAAPEDASFAMGGWFFGVALSYQLAGWIATRVAAGGHAAAAAGHSAVAGGHSVTSLADYAHVYTELFWWGLGIAVVFLIVAPWIKRLMHGVR